jgi:small subunit ribosomal protein S16
MLVIRLTRKGKKNQPFFRVVVIDKRRSSKGGRAVEDLGYKNPLTKKVSINKERVLYWIKNGAKPSPTVHNLLVAEKIIDAKKIKVTNISKKKQEEIKKASEVAAAPAEAAKPVESAPAEIPAEKPAEPAPTEEPKPEEPKA